MARVKKPFGERFEVPTGGDFSAALREGMAVALDHIDATLEVCSPLRATVVSWSIQSSPVEFTPEPAIGLVISMEIEMDKTIGSHRFSPFVDADNVTVCGYVTGPGGTGNPPEICGLPERMHAQREASA